MKKQKPKQELLIIDTLMKYKKIFNFKKIEIYFSRDRNLKFNLSNISKENLVCQRRYMGIWRMLQICFEYVDLIENEKEGYKHKIYIIYTKYFIYLFLILEIF